MMEITQPYAKILVASCTVEPSGFIELFHRWIQSQDADGLLIDVADYSHVHQGPAVLLIAHDCFYAIDHGDGRQGLVYRRRRGDAEPALESLRGACCAALRAGIRLEEELQDRIRFDTSTIVVGCDDRLRAPNTPAAFGALEPALRQLGARLAADAEIAVRQLGEPRSPFRAEIRSRAESPGDRAAPLTELLSRLQTES